MKTKELTLCALFAALIALCAWICIPIPGIPITLQTFALFLTLGTAGGRLGLWVSLGYLLLGLVGLPVFTGFQGGIGVLLGPTGGFLLSFPLIAGCYWCITGLSRGKGKLIAMVAGQLLCYTAGCLWYWGLYLKGSGSLWAAVAQCVLPYLAGDGTKLLLAWWLSRRVKPMSA